MHVCGTRWSIMEDNLITVGAVSLSATRRLFGILRDHRDCLAGLGLVVAYLVAKVWGIAS
jgi:hypothetical protein